jgi:flagellar secretion chaperone FliS
MNQTAAYQNSAVTTVPPGRIVVLLYEAAIKALKQSLIEMEAGRYVEKAQRLKKAIDIIVELRCSLDMEVGGEVAQNLENLYDFMVRHLNCVNRNEQSQHIREVIAILNDLNEAWKTISE